MPVKSLELFLSKLFDYAGLFPPAKIELGSALNNFNQYIRCKDNWMISQFIMPVQLLDNFNFKLIKFFDNKYPLNLSFLSKNINKDIKILNNFLKLHPEKVIFS